MEKLPRIHAAWKCDGKSALIHNAPLGNKYELRAEVSGPLAPQFVPMFAAAPEMLAALQAAEKGFRSYQYGNSATDLAEEMADHIAAIIAKATGTLADGGGK